MKLLTSLSINRSAIESQREDLRVIKGECVKIFLGLIAADKDKRVLILIKIGIQGRSQRDQFKNTVAVNILVY